MKLSKRYQAILEEQVKANPEISFDPQEFCSTCKTTIQKSSLLSNDLRYVNTCIEEWGKFIDGPSSNESWRRVYEDVPHHSGLEELESSAARGCHSCTIIYEGLEPHISEDGALDAEGRENNGNLQ